MHNVPRDKLSEAIDRWAWLVLIAGMAICAALVFLAGCTVRPKLVRNSEVSFDGNIENSGLIGHDQAGNAIITPHARDRYNSLMDDYGKSFDPPVQRDDGITATGTNAFLLDAQHTFYFETANRWRHENFQPRGK